MFFQIGSVSFLTEYGPSSPELLAKAFTTPREGHGVNIVIRWLDDLWT